MEVSADECKRLGLLTSAAAKPPRADLSPGERDILDAIERYGFPQIGVDL